MAWPYDDEIPDPPEGFTEPFTQPEPFTSPEPFTTTGLATTFGYNDPGESTTGAWGDQLNDPNAFGVALPVADLRRYFGDENAAHGALVEVTNQATGRTTVAPIIDKGPAQWVIDRQGPTIDLTEGARAALGGGGMDPVVWKIIGHPPEGFTEPVEAPGGPSAGQGIPPPPEGFSEVVGEPYGPNLNPKLTNSLANIEASSGFPLSQRINSGYRDPDHNAAVGGAKGSQHIHGNAVDIDVSDMPIEQRQALMLNAAKNGITGFGIYENSLHFDVGPSRAWGPSHGRESVPDWAEPTLAQIQSHDLQWEGPTPSGETETQQIPPPPEGFTEPVSLPSAAPVPELTRTEPATAVHGATPAPTPIEGQRPSYPPFTPENIRQGIPVHGWTPSPTPIGGVPRGRPEPEPPLARLAKEGWIKASELASDATGAIAKKYGEFIKPLEDPYVAMGDNVKAQKQAIEDVPDLREQLRTNQEVLTTYTAANMQDSRPMLEALGKRDQLQRKLHYAELAAAGNFPAPPKPAAVVPKTWTDDMSRGVKGALPADQEQLGSHATGVLGTWMQEFTDAREKIAGAAGGKPIEADRLNIQAFDAAQQAMPWGELRDVAQQMGLKDEKALKEVFRTLPKNIMEVDPATAGQWFVDELRKKVPGLGPASAEPVAPVAGRSVAADIAARRKEQMAIYGNQSDWVDARNNLLLGGSDKGLLMGLEGSYRFVEARTKGVPWLSTVHENASKQAKETAKIREGLRAGLPVEKEFKESFFGSATEGIGQLADVPLNLGPGVVITFGQLYQEAWEDAKQSGKQLGKEVTDAQADAAATKYMATGGFLEIAADKFILGRFLKGAADHKWTIGKTIAEMRKGAITEGTTEGAQQAILNILAASEGIDPRRPMTEDVASSFLTATVPGAAGAGGSYSLGAAGSARRTAQAKQVLAAAITQAKAKASAAQAGPAPGPTAAPPPSPEAIAAGVPAPAAAAPPEAAATTTPPAAPAESVTPPAQPVSQPAPAAAPETKKEIKTFAELPAGLGIPVGGTAAPTAAEIAEAAPGATEAELDALEQRFQKGAFAGRGAPSAGPETTTTAPKGAATLEEWANQPEPTKPTAEAAPITPEPVKKSLLGRIFGAVTGANAQDRYFAEQARIGNLTNREVYQELGFKFHDALRNNAITRQLGLPVEYGGTSGVMAVEYNAAGDISLKLNPRALLAMENVGGRSGEAINKLLGEELIHAAETILQKEDWQKAQAQDQARRDWLANPVGEPPPAPSKPAAFSFVDHVNAEGKKRWQQIKDALDKAPENEKQALYQAVLDSFDSYYASDVKGRGSLGMQAKDAGKIFEEIHRQGKTVGWVSEFARQAQQLHDQGDISESTWVRILNAIKEWMGRTVDRLKQALPGVQQGKFGPEVQAHVARIDAFLKGKQTAAPSALASKEAPGAQKIAQTPRPERVISKGGDFFIEYADGKTKGIWLTRAGAEEALSKQQQLWDAQQQMGRAAPTTKEKAETGPQDLTEKGPRLVLTEEEIDAYAREGEQFKDWYNDFHKELEEFLGPHKEYLPLVKEFLATTSAMRGIQENVRLTVEHLAHYIETGEIKFGWTTHTDNLWRAVAGKKISGPKVGEYSPALHLDPLAITMDRHMYEALFGDQTDTDQRRRIGTNAVFRAAERLGWDPAQVQAAIWGAKLRREGIDVSSKKTYGAFLEQHRQQLEAIFRGDVVHGGRGLETARRVAAGIGQRAGPERAYREVVKSAALEGVSPYEGKPPRRPKELEAGPPPIPEHVAARHAELRAAAKAKFEAEAAAKAERKAARAAKRGSAEAEAAQLEARGAPLPSEPTPPGGPFAKLRRNPANFFRGAAERFRRTPGLEFLGNAALRHQDSLAARKGELTAVVPQVNSREVKEQVAKYWSEQLGPGPTHGAAALPAHPEAARIVNEQRRLKGEIKARNQTLGLKDPGDASEYPMMLSAETLKAHEKGSGPHWQRLKDDMVAEGIIPNDPDPAVVDRAADVYLKKVEDRANDNKSIDAPGYRLPASAYEFGPGGFINWASRAADKASRREAFGSTKYTPPDTPPGVAGKNLFDRAREKTKDKRTRDAINVMEALAYGQSTPNAWSSLIHAGTSFATGTQLGNYPSTARNLLSALAGNVTRWPTSFLKMRAAVQAIPEAKTRGLIQNDLFNALNDVNHPNLFSGFASGALKAHLYPAVETIARAQALVGAKNELRRARDAYGKNPKSRRALQFMARAQRLGFGNPEGLLTEPLGGPLSDIFLRRSVNRAHGGYSYADVPLYLSGEQGGLYRQYGKFMAEHTNMIWEDIAKPLMRAAPFVPKETVPVTNPATGAQETIKVPGETLKAALYITAFAAAGGAWDWFQEWAWDKPSDWEKWNDMFEKLKKNPADFKTGWDALTKLGAAMVNLGSLGFAGSYGKAGLEMASGKSDFEQMAIEIPAMGAINDAINAVKDFKDRKDWSPAGFLRMTDQVASIFSTYRTLKGPVARGLHAADIDLFNADITAYKIDRANARASMRRMEAALGMERKPPVTGTTPTAKTALKDKLNDLVATGRFAEARGLIREETRKLHDDKAKEELMNDLKASTESKHPLGPGKARRELLLAKARKLMTPAEYQRVKRIGRDYERNAIRLELMEEKDATPKQVEDLQEKLLQEKRQRELEPGLVGQLMHAVGF